MGTIVTDESYRIPSYPNGTQRALLINPPVYDAQYWARWSQPAGLLRIGSWLKDRGYAVDLIDCMETDRRGIVPKRRRTSRDNSGRSVPVVLRRDDVVKPIYHFGLPWSELFVRM